jgi:hypothetical protein
LILCQHDPAPLSGRLEPHTVLFIASEMIVVNLHNQTSFDEFGSDWFYAE